MTEYAKKTCHECGRRLPQPQMKKVTRSIEVGRSKRSLSGREVVGTLLGSEKSAKSVARWALAPNQRTYTRNQQVWVCPECNGDAARHRAHAENEGEKERKLTQRREQLKYGSIAEEFWRLNPKTGYLNLCFLSAIFATVWTVSGEIGNQNYLPISLIFCAVVAVGFLLFVARLRHGRNEKLLKLAHLYQERVDSNCASDNIFVQENYWKGYDFSLLPDDASLKKVALRPEPLLPKAFEANQYVSKLSFFQGVVLSFASVIMPPPVLRKVGRDLFSSGFGGYTLNLVSIFLLFTASARPNSPFWSSLNPFWASVILSTVIIVLLRRPLQVLSGSGIDAEGRLILKSNFALHRILQRSPIVSDTKAVMAIDQDDLDIDQNRQTIDQLKNHENSGPKQAGTVVAVDSFGSANSTETRLEPINAIAKIHKLSHEKPVSCIRCGSTQLSARRRGFNWKMALPLGFVTGGVGLLIGFWGRKNIITTCVACGCTWKRKPTE